MSVGGEDLAGKVCACSLGRVGIVTHADEITFQNGDKGSCWCGFGLDGKGLWATGNRPDGGVIILADSLKQYAERLVSRPNSVLYANISVPAVSKK
jgi:hypothetical protein